MLFTLVVNALSPYRTPLHISFSREWNLALLLKTRLTFRIMNHYKDFCGRIEQKSIPLIISSSLDFEPFVVCVGNASTAMSESGILSNDDFPLLKLQFSETTLDFQQTSLLFCSCSSPKFVDSRLHVCKSQYLLNAIPKTISECYSKLVPVFGRWVTTFFWTRVISCHFAVQSTHYAYSDTKTSSWATFWNAWMYF